MIWCHSRLIQPEILTLENRTQQINDFALSSLVLQRSHDGGRTFEP